MRAIGYVTAAVLLLLVLVVIFATASRPHSPSAERDGRRVPVNANSKVPNIATNDAIASSAAAESEETPVPESLATEIPVNNQVIYDDAYYPNSTSLGELKIVNGASSNAVAKLVDPQTDKKILSFAISAGNQSTIGGIPGGSYRLIFGFGDRVYQGTLNFESPRGSQEYDEPMIFPTSATEYKKITVTLTPVPNGNITIHSISRAEFEKY